MLRSSYRLVLRSHRDGATFARVVKPTGWRGSYHRKPPSGYHKCLSPVDMKRLIARLES